MHTAHAFFLPPKMPRTKDYRTYLTPPPVLEQLVLAIATTHFSNAASVNDHIIIQAKRGEITNYHRLTNIGSSAIAYRAV